MSKGKTPNKNELIADQAHVRDAIQTACRASFGVLDTNFLCRSVSVLEPKAPLCVDEDSTIEAVVNLLREKKVGCVLITAKSGALKGIFSERDVVLKVTHQFERNKSRPVSEFMTKEPVTQAPDATIGFVLNLMSAGGFRHMPIVDSDGHAIGIISVKDVVDFIVKSFTDDLLAFNVAGV